MACDALLILCHLLCVSPPQHTHVVQINAINTSFCILERTYSTKQFQIVHFGVSWNKKKTFKNNNERISATKKRKKTHNFDLLQINLAEPTAPTMYKINQLRTRHVNLETNVPNTDQMYVYNLKLPFP